MNLSIKGHLMTRKVAGVLFQEPDHFIIYLENPISTHQEYVELNLSELTYFSSMEKTLVNMAEKFK